MLKERKSKKIGKKKMKGKQEGKAVEADVSSGSFKDGKKFDVCQVFEK